ncbi:MAG: alpha/beta fold hydrolase [Candidatus Hydrogenedentes bacterium]|nr:alpha/beta fold hydrolase [Candidatus Hydrogenedentota bacterium]
MCSIWAEAPREKSRPLRAAAALLLLAIALGGGCGRSQDPETSANLTLKALDGVTVAATLWMARGDHPPGLILVHRRGADRSRWSAFAAQAEQHGYRVAAVDLRGHGGSREQPPGALDYRNFEPGDWRDALLDLEAARVLLMESGADPDNLFIAGEGLGSLLALQFVRDTPELQGIVMLSPPLEEFGFDATALIAAAGDRPALLLWTEGDAHAARAAAALQDRAAGFLEAHSYPGTAQGTDIFVAAPAAAGQVFVWLEQMRDAS